jgi:hypothetical protein
MALIKAAFRYDLTRVVTFQWASGTNHVSFGGPWPPDPTVFKVHHTTSRDPASADLTECDESGGSPNTRARPRVYWFQ